MPKTREIPPKKRTPEPTHDLARKGSEPSSGQVTPAGPLTERSGSRAMKDKQDISPTGPKPADDNARAAQRAP
jgi:hypothetical protein